MPEYGRTILRVLVSTKQSITKFAIWRKMCLLKDISVLDVIWAFALHRNRTRCVSDTVGIFLLYLLRIGLKQTMSTTATFVDTSCAQVSFHNRSVFPKIESMHNLSSNIMPSNIQAREAVWASHCWISKISMDEFACGMHVQWQNNPQQWFLCH